MQEITGEVIVSKPFSALPFSPYPSLQMKLLTLTYAYT